MSFTTTCYHVGPIRHTTMWREYHLQLSPRPQTGRTAEKTADRGTASQLQCLVLSLNATSCQPLNTTCLCLDTVFESVVTKCVQSTCTVREMLAIKNGTASNCGLPETDPKDSLLAITIVLTTLQTIFFSLRMLCRAVRIAPWGWDDTTIVPGFVGHIHTTGLTNSTPWSLKLTQPLRLPGPHYIICRRCCPRGT